jgi:hypothetical protein
VTKVPGGSDIDSLAIAMDVIRRGIMPVPVPYGKKGPVISHWQQLTITAENTFQHFNGHNLNVGGVMGPKSSGLTDVDLDCEEAVILAPFFLPPTKMIYGRKNQAQESLSVPD